MSELIEFVNRNEELAFLLRHAPPKSKESCAIALRAPSGYGKSALMTRFCANLSDLGINHVIVDPDVRGKTEKREIHDGFFAQACAVALDKAAQSGEISTPTFSAFLKSKRGKLVASRGTGDLYRKAPGFKTWYETLVDYAERTLLKGEYAPPNILNSTNDPAVDLARSYLSESYPSSTVFVFREAQHFDQVSFRFVLDVVRKNNGFFAFFEYTSDQSEFRAQHHEIIKAQGLLGLRFHWYQLLKLKPHHVTYLLRLYTNRDIELSSDYYLSWDGNLRSIEELRYRVTIGGDESASDDLSPWLNDAVEQYRKHIISLNGDQRMLLALINANIQPLSSAVLSDAYSRINARTAYSDPNADVDALLNTHNLITHTEKGELRIDNEDVSEAIETIPAMVSFLAYARKALKECYLEYIEKAEPGDVPLIESVAQAFMFSGVTADSGALVLLVKKVESLVGGAINPKRLIDTVYPLVESDDILFDDDRQLLIRWAIDLLYDTGQYKKALKLIPHASEQSDYIDLLEANCAIESGAHIRAKELLDCLRTSSAASDLEPALVLLEALIARTNNDAESAQQLLEGLIKSTPEQSPFHAYALRFMETVREFPAVIHHTLKSAVIFENLGYFSSEAYSRLASAMHLTRSGDVETAKYQVDVAQKILSSLAGDLHVARNNQGAVELSTLSPNLKQCRNLLDMARWTVEDDYSELVINTNLAITNSLLNMHEHADQLIKASVKILNAPDFGDRDVFWGVAYNAHFVLDRCGKAAEGRRIMQQVASEHEPPIIYRDYWLYRFNLTDEPPDGKYSHMLAKQYHPLFLSHWQIDREGIKSLFSEH